METLRRISVKKPIVAFKMGRSEAGSQAATTHTGSLAGSYAVYEAAFRQVGVITVSSVRELLFTLLGFACLPLPRGKRCFIMSQTGGMGIFATDESNRYPEIELCSLSPAGERRLREAMPPMATMGRVAGYADIGVAATIDQHLAAIDIGLEDDAIDALVFLTVIPTFIDRKKLGEALAGMIRQTGKFEKPLFPVILAGDYVRDLRHGVEEAGMLTFEMPEDALGVLARMIRYQTTLQEREVLQ